MIDFIQSLMAFIFALGILITFHEFGHYWVARKCKVKILRFSVGFGKPIWRFDFRAPFWHLGFTHSPWNLANIRSLFRQREFDKEETEFVLAALPLGGYVKMLDEREAPVAEAERRHAFNTLPVSQRLAIVAAGPFFNFIFAIVAYWLTFMIGVTGLKPVIEEVAPDSIAMQAGFIPGQQILSVDTSTTPTWLSVMDITVARVVDGGEVVFEVRNPDGNEQSIRLDLGKVSIDEMASGQLLEQLGLKPRVPEFPATIGEVTANGAAARAGLQQGDTIITADSKPVSGWVDWVEYVRAHAGEPIQITFLRDGQTRDVTITPEAQTLDSGEVVGRIGAAFDNRYQPDASMYTLENYSPIPALLRAVDRTWEMSVMTLQILGKMIVGQASVKNLSGPITIAKYAGDTANLGIVAFLGFLAVVSVSLGVLNLLPVPLLDGGHILYYLIEGVKGSPVSDSIQVIGQQLGLVLLLSLMGLAFYNDILRVVG
jgi:regulator of sigma E protease